MPNAPAARGAPAAQAQENGTRSTIITILQMVGVFIACQWLIANFSPNKKASPGSKPAGGLESFDKIPARTEIANYSLVPQAVAPIWEMGTAVDISIYVSASLSMPALKSVSRDTLVLDEKKFVIGDWKEDRKISTTFPVPVAAQRNGTLWAHFFVAHSGSQLDPIAKDWSSATAYHFSRPLNQFLPKTRARKYKNLLDKSEGVEEEENLGPRKTIQSFYHPNFTLAAIPDTGVQGWSGLHPDVRSNFQLEPTGGRDASGQVAYYYPVFFLNRFWQLKSQMTEINETVERLPLNIDLNNLANWKFSMFAAMDESMRRQQVQAATSDEVSMTGDGSDFEKFKEILLDTNSYLLATTVVVTILHMVFEGLAFKNDISHWRKKKDVIGTSIRTILANVFMQSIILLYLFDNSDNTSWMILMSQGFGILVEAWKITKVMNVKIQPPSPDSTWSFLPLVIVLEDKHKLSEVEQRTKEYDSIAFNYLYIIAVPLLLAYAAYSLKYETHKSWYSFVIETLVGSVYAYGFLMMVPSLYINYRLKSVAHMPGKAMTYKFLNTFIDDLFAFTIRMPTLHRLATLRDDVIFFVYIYQTYKYKVDYTRVNEFGQGGDDEDEKKEVSDGTEGDKVEGKTVDGKTGAAVEAAAASSARESGQGAQRRKGK